MTDSTVSIDQLTAWLAHFESLLAEQQEYLTELDDAIGDGDHGSNMARGMAAVMDKLRASSPAVAVDELFKAVGMTLVSSAGGASGPLYGTFFLRFGMNAGAAPALTAVGLAAALRAGLEGVVARGSAEIGDKTMVDALSPAIDAYDTAVAAGAGIAAAASASFEAAKTGRDATGPLVARKGRAGDLAERSTAHLDPGAASTALLFEALAVSLAAK